MNNFIPLGQIPFTNYLSQPIVTSITFYVFGLFDKVQQCEAYYGVAAVRGSRSFLVIFGWRYFRFGPGEWFWRSLIYMSNPCPEKRETVVAEPVPHGVSG